MNFPFVPPASNAATLRWKNWIAIHFLITGVAVLTLSGFSSVMGIWVLEDYGLTLSAPGWELMRGAKVVGEILSGLGLVLFIILSSLLNVSSTGTPFFSNPLIF